MGTYLTAPVNHFVLVLSKRRADRAGEIVDLHSPGPAVQSLAPSVGVQSMMFTKRLRDPVMRGEVTCSVRIWRRPHVKVGGRYALGPGAIQITALREIALSDITPDLARRSGFQGVVDLLKVAKHGPGERVFLVEFEYRAGPDAPSADL
jgi:hypothetical protein